MATTRQMKLVSTSHTYWEKCWDPQICAHIPFDHDKCLRAHICVRIIEDSGSFYLEVEIEGHRARYGLTNACIPTFAVGIAHLDVCAANVQVNNGVLQSLELIVKACIGGDIGPIHLEKCWDLFNETIKFTTLSASDLEVLSSCRASDKATTYIAYGNDSTIESQSCCCK